MSALKPKALRIAAVLTMSAAALSLGACAPGSGAKWAAAGHAADIPAATPTGKAVTCIPITSIRESRVRDDWTIDFRTGGDTWYRNTLPNRCSNLGFERSFSYATSLAQLCNVDIITVFRNGGGPTGPLGSCGLGMFQPVKLAKEGKK
ncbi:hypothetical protein [Novosphingobium sp. NDB2Meth1]|uniref:hypothetical protein n=1 Tax=Novosphingobium sp. NDB2Meth1 TaxID=1892847 RepID=UPI000A58F9BF|nr:hypothetical protein [Novosphingobium sp. NDB2Meth1]